MNDIIRISLGIGVIVTGLLSFYQSYQIVWKRDSLWIEEEKLLIEWELEAKREKWDSAQLAQLSWWIVGGVSGVIFGLWLLALQP